MNERCLPRRRPAISTRLALVLGVLAASCGSGGGLDVTSEGAPAPRDPKRFEALPDFTFDDSRGGQLSKADLLGEPWIGVPFFLECTGPCPSITRDIRERLYPVLEGTGVKLVSFSLDPERDTPEALDAYARTLDVDRDRWLFVSAPEEGAMHDFVRTGLWVPVQRDPEANDAGLAITHGTRMPVVDGSGVIAGLYELADPTLATGMSGEEAMPLAEAEALLDARFALIADRAKALAAGGSVIPLVNACLNGTAFVLLIAGFLAIKRGAKKQHELLMKLAFVVSAAFLAFYLYYHFAVLPISGGPTRFNGEGPAKVAYLLMLASHVLLAVVNLPMVLRTFWLAHREDWDRHKRLAKLTLPIWLYVSITGVLVYLVLYQFNPPA
ncbi:MAG: DUF420 domain-containing protein [Planctomycetota bacterium]|nr:DUF420 domain-containing protein [Planctomycetota bacterium]